MHPVLSRRLPNGSLLRRGERSALHGRGWEHVLLAGGKRLAALVERRLYCRSNVHLRPGVSMGLARGMAAAHALKSSD